MPFADIVRRFAPDPSGAPDPPRPRGLPRAVVETTAAAVASGAMYAVVERLWSLPHPGFQALAMAAGLALFPLRRRHPAAVLLALAALAGAAPVVGPVTAAASYTVARGTARPRRRIRLLGGAGLLVAVSATATGPWLGTGSAVYGLATGLVLVATAVVVPGLAGTVYGQQGRLLRALRERGDAAERARLLADSEARAHERSRIAAEMHDLVGHRLSLVSLHAGGLELALDRAAPELRDEAVLVRRTTGEAMRELRQALGVLGPLGRDTGTDALTDATGTRADIEALVAESREGGIALTLHWRGADLGTRPATVRRAVHRVVREALTNVHRYATTAHVTVTVAHDDTSVRVAVRNGAPPHDGGARRPGTRPDTGADTGADGDSGIGTGRGLTGLRERVELLGGTFRAGALPSGGFQVEAVVPAEPYGDPGAGGVGGAGSGGAGGSDSDSYSESGGWPGAAATAALPVEACRADRLGQASLGGAPDAAADAAADRATAGALTLALAAVALWVLMVLGVAFVYAGRPQHTAAPPPPRLGATYQDLRGVIDNPVVRAAATGHEPPRPAGAVGCVYPATGTEPRPGALLVTRYCFDTAQRLIAIDRFTVPSVRDGAPWQTP